MVNIQNSAGNLTGKLELGCGKGLYLGALKFGGWELGVLGRGIFGLGCLWALVWGWAALHFGLGYLGIGIAVQAPARES